MAYATLEDLAAYIGITQPEEGSEEEARLTRVLDRASRQLDQLITWGGTRDDEGHLRVDTEALSTWDAECLRRAACAQAEYRLYRGEEFFIGGKYQETTTPDGWNTKGTQPLISPAAWDELSQASPSLFRRSGVGYSGSRRSWED